MSYEEQLLTLHEHCVHPYFYLFVVVKFEKNRASTQEIIKRIINYDDEGHRLNDVKSELNKMEGRVYGV